MPRGSLTNIGRKKWWGRIDVPTKKGEGRKQATKTFHCEQGDELDRQYREWVNEVRGEVKESNTVAVLLDRWSEYLAKRVEIKGLKNNTRKSYIHASQRIRGQLGGLEGDKLTMQDVTGFVQYLNSEDICATYVRYHITVLSMLLNFGVAFGHIPINPMIRFRKVISLPAIPARRPPVIDLEIFEEILSKSTQKTLTLMMMFDMNTGLRRGELPSLQWKNMDLDQRIIYVESQLDPDADEFDTMDPKTKTSIRTVPIVEEDLTWLRGLRQEQRERKAILKGAYRDYDLVFAKENGTPYKLDYISRYFKKITTKMGLSEVKFHHIRHTFASEMIRCGVKIEKLSEILGHFNPSFTYSVYVHLLNVDKLLASDLYGKYRQEKRAKMGIQTSILPIAGQDTPLRFTLKNPNQKGLN